MPLPCGTVSEAIFVLFWATEFFVISLPVDLMLFGSCGTGGTSIKGMGLAGNCKGLTPGQTSSEGITLAVNDEGCDGEDCLSFLGMPLLFVGDFVLL